MSGARPERILVTGATGYIGGRLVPRLLAEGRPVRCLVRDPSRVGGRGWRDVEVIGGDVADAGALEVAMRSVDVAYYLVHSMAGGESFRERDRDLAAQFARAASSAGLRRIIYLGGLGDPAAVRSRHLVSRHEVGAVLASTGVPVVELRAGLIVGSGSASFEMMRTLAERLPIMVMPRWVDSRCQPIGVRNVLEYLLEAIDHPTAAGVYEIGGADVLTYRQMMQRYAQARGLRRAMVAFAVPHPEWGGTVAGLVTPIPRRIAEPLVESLQTDMVVRDDRAAREFAVRPMSYDEAVALALHRITTDSIETTWASSLASLTDERTGVRELADHEGMLLERHQAVTRAPPSRVFEEICALGGDAGWPAGNWLWQVRGVFDRLVGGVGMRRGRRHPRELLVGEPLDFWRVEALEPCHLLRLRAEMRMPGRAWLQFEVLPHRSGARVQQTAFFEPRGALGHLYWYALMPFHRWIFPGLIRSLCERAESRSLALPIVASAAPAAGA